MTGRIEGAVWVVIGGLAATAVWITMIAYTTVALGLLAGVAVCGLYTATTRLSGVRLPTAAVTLSTGVIVSTVSITVVATRWLPAISTAALGYAVGILATWLLVSGVSLDELGSFAAVGGLGLAVVGGGVGLLIVDDAVLFLALLVAGLAAGVVIPLSGRVAALFRAGSARAADDSMSVATRFGVEATVIALLAITVPFGSRAVALFGYGGPAGFPVGLAGGGLLSLGLTTLAAGHADRLVALRDRYVERVSQLGSRIRGWLERRQGGSRRDPEESADEARSEEEPAAAAGEEGSLAAASDLVNRAADRVADHGLVIEAAERLETLTDGGPELTGRMEAFWGRFKGAVVREGLTAGAALQLSAAEEAGREDDPETARSRVDAALELAAPTIGSVAAAIVRGRRETGEGLLDALAPLLARLDQLLAEEPPPEDPDDLDQYQYIQQMLERLIGEESEGFDTALSTIRAAAADGWYSVQAGDGALEDGNYQRALTAYVGAIEAYRRAYDVATDAAKTATAERAAPDDEPATTDGDRTVEADASTYAAEADRIATALEAVCHDTAAVVIAAVEDLYGAQPPPTVDTDARRTIIRTLRTLRETRTRIDATVPPVDLADDRYQHAEIGRSVARLRRHLSTADGMVEAGNPEAAADHYERVADRLNVLGNRAGTAGLGELARRLLDAEVAVAKLADDPSPEAVDERPPLSVPETTDNRAPEVAPVSRRLRRTFCDPGFVGVWEFVGEAADHPVLEVAGEPYPDLLGAAEMALSSLDPIYTEPDVGALREWLSKLSTDALSTAVTAASEHSRRIDASEVAVPPAFDEPPAILKDASVTTLPTAEGIDTLAETWADRATAVAEAADTAERRAAAVDGFAALEDRLRTVLDDRGQVDANQLSPDLLEVAAYNLTGVAYDREAGVLSKTGEIERRSHDEGVDAEDGPTDSEGGEAEAGGVDDAGDGTSDETDAVDNEPPA
ncbi:hypothetical protein [Halohasta salina]|uniref:hypothetical protein n=1 Tax=Halohasta salina TaxID=2961621 RepID=UPI0020A3C628|nr:hypothetical protein [Halohasta salina]